MKIILSAPGEPEVAVGTPNGLPDQVVLLAPANYGIREGIDGEVLYSKGRHIGLREGVTYYVTSPDGKEYGPISMKDEDIWAP